MICLRRCYSCIGLLGVLVAASLASIVQADWPSFRNGGSSLTDDSLPVDWSDDSGIAWQHELEGYGQSSPVIADGKVHTTAVVGSNCDTCLIECRDLQHGELVWVVRTGTRLFAIGS